MPYVSVHVDAEDVLCDISTEDLRKELHSRSRKNGDYVGSSADYRIPLQVAKYTLDEAAAIFRKEGRTDLAFKLDEIKCDFVEH
jgi:hypothetical protein